jgi:N-acetylmuramoyl-L-alanine amidase
MIRLAVDPGHGMANRARGQFDPGAVAGDVAEAEIALAYGLAVERAALARGWDVVMTRRNQVQDCPLGLRAAMARRARCDALVSLHCNAADAQAATGTETLYWAGDGLARRLQRTLTGVLGLRDRGVKMRDLAVLKFDRSCALIELGFLTNPWDRSRLLAIGMDDRVAEAICDAVAA